MRWRSRSATVCVTASATRRSRKHVASRSTSRIDQSAAPSRTAPPFEVIAPPSNAPTSLRPPELPKSNSSWLHCVGIGEHLLASRSRCGTTTFAESEPRCSSRPGEIQASGRRQSALFHHRLGRLRALGGRRRLGLLHRGFGRISSLCGGGRHSLFRCRLGWLGALFGRSSFVLFCRSLSWFRGPRGRCRFGLFN